MVVEQKSHTADANGTAWGCCIAVITGPVTGIAATMGSEFAVSHIPNLADFYSNSVLHVGTDVLGGLVGLGAGVIAPIVLGFGRDVWTQTQTIRRLKRAEPQQK